MFRVIHRPDQLLQGNVQRSKQEGPTGNSFHDNVSLTHATLLGFIDDRLIGKKFKDYSEIREVLKDWYFYAAEKRLRLQDVWTDLTIFDNRIQTDGDGMGGPFVCALVEEISIVASV